jgi:type IV pilus assembly protein PilY1
MKTAWLACMALMTAPLPALCAPPLLNVPHGQLMPGAAGPLAAWRSGDGGFVIQAGDSPPRLTRHALLIGAGGDASTAAAAEWDAAALLAARAPEDRHIYTFSGQTTVPFTWAGLPAPLRAMLDAGALGELRTAYLRGDRRRELGQPAGLFRKREGVLGDIVHSVPLIVGPPAPSQADVGYAAFREQARGRPLVTYVGADDGMLHAFDASNGSELFAYVPRTLVSALAASSDPGFVARSFVDGSAGYGDAVLGARWKSVLVSGMGMGARGVFALDISDPAAFGQGSGALWEFTEADDPIIGYVQAAPQVVKVNTAARGRVAAYRYFAVVPSGINNAALDGNGALFLLALDKPPASRWQEGLNYHRIATTGANPALPNALSAAGLVIAADGSASLAYAGDLQGNLWRFDLAAKTAQRLFTAVDAGGHTQPIAHAPKALFAPGGGYLVVFGTGKLIEKADLLPSSFGPQSLYGILDRLEVPAIPVRSRAQLVKRTLSAAGGTDGDRLDYFALGAKRGWYIDLAVDGERGAGTPDSVSGALIFTTVLPGADPDAQPQQRRYVLDALSGMTMGADSGASASLAPAVALLPPLLVETGVAMAGRGASGRATATRTFSLISSAVASSAPGIAQPAVKVRVSFPAMRLGWREVANWQELHDAATR